jgi:hypothetical protein
MKYTKYLIKGEYININALETDWILLKVPMRLISIVVAGVGILAIFGMMPMTIVVDEARNTKCFYIRFKRRGYKL